MESPNVVCTIHDLPAEILLEIFQELDTLSQIRLSRVSSEWKSILQGPRLRKSARLDIELIYPSNHGLKRYLEPFIFSLGFSAGRASCIVPLDREEVEDLLYKCISTKIKIVHIKLSSATPDQVSELLWTVFCVHFLWTLLRIGQGITHLLLEDAWVDGSFELWKYFAVPGKMPTRFDGIATPHSLRVVSFKNCLFSIQKRFYPAMVWFPNGRFGTYGGRAVKDCVYGRLPKGCKRYTKIPFLTFNLHSPTQAEKDIQLLLDLYSDTIPLEVLKSLEDKARMLPEDARTKWKTELQLNDLQYRGIEIKEIDLNAVNWSTLRKTTQHFFLCFKALYDPQVHHYDPFHGYV